MKSRVSGRCAPRFKVRRVPYPWAEKKHFHVSLPAGKTLPPQSPVYSVCSRDLPSSSSSKPVSAFMPNIDWTILVSCDHAEAAPLVNHLNEVLDTGIAAVRLRPCCVILSTRHLKHPNRFRAGRKHTMTPPHMSSVGCEVLQHNLPIPHQLKADALMEALSVGCKCSSK